MLWLPLPERFDANEWFIILAAIIGFACIYMLPKRFPTSMSLLSCLFPLLLSKLFDTILVFPPFEDYYVNDSKQVEWFDFLLYFVYAPIGYLYMYAFDRFHPKPVGTVVVLTLTAVISVLFEWVTVQLGTFHYTGWKISNSLPVYVAVQSLFIILLDHLKKVYARTKR